MIKKTLLKDIARHVGVSTALVSYVLNDQAEEKRVGREVAERIRKAAKELNYRPNQIAKSLKTSKTNTIGLIVASINYRFTTVITSAIESAAKKNNYTVIFGSSDEDLQKFSDLINVFINRQVDGLIVLAVENSQAEIQYLKKQGIPFVLVDRIFPEITTNYVGLDNFQAAYQSILHLIDTGHKRIGFINYKTSLFHLNERTRGFWQALKDRKLPVKRVWHKKIRKKTLVSDMQKAINELVNDSPACDAVFFTTDTLAINGLKIINSMNLKVPDDIAVMSFDEAEAFELFYCPITYARQPMEEMGEMAVDILLNVMKDKKFCKQIYLESTFIKRKSCGEK